MTTISEKRIVPVINPTENQKAVLAKITAADTPKLAAADISANKNLTAARDMLVKLGIITLDRDGAALTSEGEQVMIDQGLVDESGQLTELGQKAAYGEDAGEQQMESYKVIRTLKETADRSELLNKLESYRNQYSDVPSELLDNLTPEEALQMYDVLDGNSEFYDHKSMYEKVYSFFVQDMPYGTAKARDGDPDQWLHDRLSAGIEGGRHSEDPDYR